MNSALRQYAPALFPAILLHVVAAVGITLGLESHDDMNRPPLPEVTVELQTPEPPKLQPPPPLPRPEPRQVPQPRPLPAAKPEPQPAPVLATREPVAPSPTAPAPVPPVPPTPPAPEPVSAPRFDAAYLDNPRPAYPMLARRNGDQGTVTLRVHVTADGRADDVQLKTSSGSPALDRAARNAVENWRFVPARQGAKPVPAWVLVPVVFKLEE